jgi:cell division protein FtsI/penicillin-binding protein 2
LVLGRRQFLTLASAALGARASGCALLLEIRSKRLLYVQGELVTREWLAAPGSTVKPISLWALLRSGKLKPDETFLCPLHLRLAGLQMNCSHPRLPFPVNATGAIAYSCNCATAHFAERFRGNELAHLYQELGFESATGLLPSAEMIGHVQQALYGEQLQLQALGERGVRVTALEMAEAYRRLALRAHEATFLPILEGLEGAVEAGTGQRAQIADKKVAGKTGSVEVQSGLHAAWFAGFAPSRDPEVVVTVLTQGRSGAEAAAPIAGDLLRRYFSMGRL